MRTGLPLPARPWAAACAPVRALLALWALLSLLAGCGPGVGGTGAGSDAANEPPAAMPMLAALCDSELAPLLRCTAAPGTAAGALGTQLTWLADGTDARDALARVEGNAVALELACSGLQFSGTWALAGGQLPRFHGSARATASADSQPATLSAQRAGALVVAQVFDAAGQALSPPLTLQVVPAAPPVRSPCR